MEYLISKSNSFFPNQKLTKFKPKQVQCLEAAKKQDVLGVLPTGSGKTIIIQCLPFLGPDVKVIYYLLVIVFVLVALLQKKWCWTDLIHADQYSSYQCWSIQIDQCWSIQIRSMLINKHLINTDLLNADQYRSAQSWSINTDLINADQYRSDQCWSINTDLINADPINADQYLSDQCWSIPIWSILVDVDQHCIFSNADQQ